MRLSALLGLSFVMALSGAALATPVDNCFDKKGAAQVKACTLIIDSGRISGPKKFATLYKLRGLGHFAAGNDDAAMRDFNKSLSLNPTDPKVYVGRGLVYNDIGKKDLALADFSNAIGLGYKSAMVFRLRGGYFYDKKKWDKALRDYNAAIKLDPEYSVAYSHRARIWMLRKDYEKTESDINKAVETAPRDKKTRKARVLFLLFRKKHQDALNDTKFLIDNFPDDSQSFSLHGEVYEKLGRIERAIKNYRQALSIDASNQPAKDGLNRLRGKVTAKQAPEKAKPDAGDKSIYEQAEDLRVAKKYRKAIVLYNKVLKLEPRHGLAIYGRGLSRYELKEIREAGFDFRLAIELLPKDKEIHGWLGEVYLEEKKYEKAIPEYRIAIKANGKDDISLNNLAWCYYKLGRAAEGLPAANLAVTLKPMDAANVATRGNIYEAMGRKQAAIADYRKALSLDPTQKDSIEGLKRLVGSAPAPQKLIEKPVPKQKAPRAGGDIKSIWD